MTQGEYEEKDAKLPVHQDGEAEMPLVSCPEGEHEAVGKNKKFELGMPSTVEGHCIAWCDTWVGMELEVTLT